MKLTKAQRAELREKFGGRCAYCGCELPERWHADHYEPVVRNWRSHSAQFARGEKPPATLETAQAAWERDQEVIFEQKAEIGRLSQKVNQLRQKLAGLEGDKWKPIDTAPKDGTEILVWHRHSGQFIASYTSADAFPLTQAEIDAMDEEALFSRDWFTQWPHATRLEGSEVPSHWMPLPAPPSA